MHGTLEQAFRVEWRPIADMHAIAAEWRALAVRVVEPNVFYEPAFARAAARVFGNDVGAGLVWSRSMPARLLGFFPARIERRRYGVLLPVLVGWTHPFAPLGTPLVAPELTEPVVNAWLDHVAGNPQLPKLMLLPYLPADGPCGQAFNSVVDRRGGQARSFARHARALLVPGAERERYLEHALPHKKRKELRRQRKRLADQGLLISASTGEDAAVLRAVDDFLVLEASGWKGRAGTAARNHADLRKFLQTAVSDLAGEGKARVARLLLDIRSVAAIIVLRSGTTAWCWKIAYDESFARFSPGVQLLLDVTRDLLGDQSVSCADSCAEQNHPMINHIWRERLVLADRLISVGPESAMAFRFASMLEAARRAAIRGAKSLRGLMRRR